MALSRASDFLASPHLPAAVVRRKMRASFKFHCLKELYPRASQPLSILIYTLHRFLPFCFCFSHVTRPPYAYVWEGGTHYCSDTCSTLSNCQGDVANGALAHPFPLPLARLPPILIQWHAPVNPLCCLAITFFSRAVLLVGYWFWRLSSALEI
jgi:hypothetical protein